MIEDFEFFAYFGWVRSTIRLRISSFSRAHSSIAKTACERFGRAVAVLSVPIVFDRDLDDST